MFVDKKGIPFHKRLLVRVFGKAFAYEKDSLKFFFQHCPTHGYYVEHERGYYGKLTFPKCLEERTKQLQKRSAR
jgi:hypothetical protein